ncbi:MAG: hypothetical protein KC441_08775 [Anaerolineales bacterium]|nr:hypothetical protein [Anaerolineales bacterium]MCB8987281.1 hypothetical protein [Ardenticatenaceae bacterium]
MLEHLRQRVEEVLKPVRQANLSTSGPAGIQARVLPCEAHGMLLYLLVPSTSDQLFNLECSSTAVVSTAEWQLRGDGLIMDLAQAPPALNLPRSPEAVGCMLVKIRPARLQINHPKGWGFGETIDIDEE